MNALLIEKQLQEYTALNGGHEQRFYLGMSSISQPDDKLLEMLLNGSPKPSSADYLRLALGYETEAAVRARLTGAGLYRPDSQRELSAWFDNRFVGHTDGECQDGSLLEIKSTLDRKLADIERTGQLPTHHYQQVQMYLAHGRYSRGFVLYFARDTGRILVRHVVASKAVIDELNAKARRVLAEYDRIKRLESIT